VLVILIVLATLPFEGLTIMGLPLVRSAGLLLVFAFLLKLLLSYSDGFHINRKHLFIFISLAVLILFSAVRSNNTNATFVIVISLISNLLFFVIFYNFVKSPKAFSLSLLVLAFSFFVSTIIALNIDLEVIQISDELNDDLRFSALRQAGFLRNANRYGYFALMIFWGGAILYSLKLSSTKLSLAIAVIGLVTVFMSMSRSIIIGLMIGLIYLLMIWNAKRSLIAVCFGCVVMLTSSLFLSSNHDENILTNMLVKRFEPEEFFNSGSTSARTSIWQDTLERIGENLVLGIPLGSLDGVIGKSGHKTHDPHNSFLYIIQYFGLLGLMVILAYFLWISRIFFSAGIEKKVKLLLVMFSLSMLMPNIFHTTLTWKPTLLMFCFIVSILRFSRNKSLPPSDA
jgi:O-antigen ligase